jgi:hypothetical protein
MKFVSDRPYADPEAAARKLLDIIRASLAASGLPHRVNLFQPIPGIGVSPKETAPASGEREGRAGAVVICPGRLLQTCPVNGDCCHLFPPKKKDSAPLPSAESLNSAAKTNERP